MPDGRFSIRHAAPARNLAFANGLRRRNHIKEAFLLTSSWQCAALATAVLITAALVAGGAGAYAATQGPAGTVNAYTAQELSRARAVAHNADYQSAALAFAQDGNIFLNATRDGELYQVT